VPTLGKLSGEQMPEKLINRARNGAARLEYAARLRSPKQLRRAMRAVTFAVSLKAFRGDPLYALQSHRPEVRLFGLFVWRNYPEAGKFRRDSHDFEAPLVARGRSFGSKRRAK